MLDDSFVAVSGRIKALEQTFDRISQPPDQAGFARPGPRGIVEYEAGLHDVTPSPGGQDRKVDLGLGRRTRRAKL